MLKRTLAVAIAILTIVLFSCDSKSKKESNSVIVNDSIETKSEITETPETDEHGKIIDKSDEVISHKIEGEENWLTKKNLRYGFEIDVPTTWNAFDSSGNGDGFSIQIPDNHARLKVYGENNSTELLNMYLDLCSSSQDFSFKSGHTGTICINKNERTYFQNSSNVLLNVYISNIELLNSAQKKQFETMCKSLRFTNKNTELVN
jgi:hypothetical protein